MYINTGSNGLIIIDAVLTNKGRLMLRQGSFNVVKFKCSDEGVDYSLNTSSILALRVLEAPVDETQSLIYTLYSDIASVDDGTQVSNR